MLRLWTHCHVQHSGIWGNPVRICFYCIDFILFDFICEECSFSAVYILEYRTKRYRKSIATGRILYWNAFNPEMTFNRWILTTEQLPPLPRPLSLLLCVFRIVVKSIYPKKIKINCFRSEKSPLCVSIVFFSPSFHLLLSCWSLRKCEYTLHSSGPYYCRMHFSMNKNGLGKKVNEWNEMKEEEKRQCQHPCTLAYVAVSNIDRTPLWNVDILSAKIYVSIENRMHFEELFMCLPLQWMRVDQRY